MTEMIMFMLRSLHPLEVVGIAAKKKDVHNHSESRYVWSVFRTDDKPVNSDGDISSGRLDQIHRLVARQSSTSFTIHCQQHIAFHQSRLFSWTTPTYLNTNSNTWARYTLLAVNTGSMYRPLMTIFTTLSLWLIKLFRSSGQHLRTLHQTNGL